MSSKKKKRKKSEIYYVLNGERTDLLLKDIPRSKLLTYDPTLQIANNTARKLLAAVRPSIGVPKPFGRYSKDTCYQVVRTHLEELNNPGDYIGLAADYPGEIFVCCFPYIRGKFLTFEWKKKNYEALIPYQEFLGRAYPQRTFGVDFHLIKGDIIEGMCERQRTVGFADIDLMCGVREPMIKRIVEGFDCCLKNKAVAALWQTVGRFAPTDEELATTLRPYLYKELRKKFSILKHDIFDYNEGYPLRVDIFTLERKAA